MSKTCVLQVRLIVSSPAPHLPIPEAQDYPLPGVPVDVPSLEGRMKQEVSL